MQKLKRLIALYIDPKGALVRHSLAFSIMMAMTPIVALLSGLSLLLLQDNSWLQIYLATIIPQDIVDALVNVGTNPSTNGIIPYLFSIGLALYTASRGFYAAIVGFATYRDYQPHPFWLTVQSLVSTVLFIVLTVLIVSMNTIVHILFPALPLLLNIGLTIFFYHIFGALFLILTSQPLLSYRDVMYGAWTFAVGVTCLGSFFFFYINNFTNYQDVYGSIAAFLIVILSIYYISCLLYFSFCVNQWMSE